jgi:RNA-dependent RNA polymerase
MRRESSRRADDFCLVHLKADPSDPYFRDLTEIHRYFRAILLAGIELAGRRYHLYGMSNSQLKDRSFWFVRAASLDDIHRKRQRLGQLDRIHHVGTYVARLGLWFSTTDPTDVRTVDTRHRTMNSVSSTSIIQIKLRFCTKQDEFNRYIEQREMCVTMIDDIERNQFCFTDGNGLMSKGLAKLIAERLRLTSNHRSETVRFNVNVRAHSS